MANFIKLAPGDYLFREGEKSDSMYWVQTGQLGVFKKEVVIGQVNQGELVGEMSFLDKAPRSANVKALTACDLIEIPRDTLEKIFQTQPKWLEMLVKTLADRLRKANARIRT